MDHIDAVRRYYDAYRTRNRAELETLLAPDFHFVSSFGEFRGRDAMLDAIWPAVGRAWATRLQIFGTYPEFVVLYEHETAPGAERPPMRMAEHLRFDGDAIAAIEVFVGRELDANTSADDR